MCNNNTTFKIFRIVIGCVFALSLAGCGSKKEVQLSGKTMGTTYHISLVAGNFFNPASLKARIDQRLEEINRSMSTYRKDSEISRFNTSTRTGEKFIVSRDFWQVMTVAKKIYELTGGGPVGIRHRRRPIQGPRKNRNSSEIGQYRIQPDRNFS
jgi:thiamine biosynthesis lipoprotein ApbE